MKQITKLRARVGERTVVAQRETLEKTARTQATPARKNNTWEHKSEDLFTQKTHQKDRVFERLHQRKYFFTQSNTCDNKVNGNNKQVTDPSL